VSSLSQSSGERVEAVIREVVETLAPIDRTPCSQGERESAEWLAARLEAVEGVRVSLEDEDSWGTFPPTATALGLLGVAGALLVLRRRPVAGVLAVALGIAGIVDEAQNGPRLYRRAMRRRRRTVNVVADAGDPGAQRTLVVLAHHDAPQTGMLFDQSLQKRLYELAPERVGRAKKPLPQWWLGMIGPAFTFTAVATRRRRLALGGVVLGTMGSALVADVWRSATVQGANDNLSGVAALVGLAEMMREEPSPGLRVLLVSCGAEETLQDGIRAFLARHRSELDPQRTIFVNLDTVGSPHLVMLEAEGPIWMEEYEGPWLRDLLADSAAYMEIPLERGFRARASTDSIIPSRAGYPTATLLSITDWRSPANYHLPSDVPANLDYRTVMEATRLVHEVIGRLAAEDLSA